MPCENREQADRIILKLREAEFTLARGETVSEAAEKTGVTEQTCCRWETKYGDLRMDQPKRLEDLATSNARRERPLAFLRWPSDWENGPPPGRSIAVRP